MFDTAAEDLTKAKKLMASDPSQKDSANRFIKLSKRLFDVYKLFMDTFHGNLNVVAAKSILLFSRVCFIVSQRMMSQNWFELPDNTNTKKRLITLPKRAVHKVYKRTFKQAFYLFNHDDEDYQKLGFGKIDINAGKRNYGQELKTVAAGIKEIGFRLLYLFNSTDLLTDEAKKQTPKGTVLALKDLNFDVALMDLQLARDIVVGYYLAIVAQNTGDGLDEDESGGAKLIIDVLSPLMNEFGMKLRTKVVSAVYDKNKTKGMFSEMTDSRGELIEVCKLLVLLDEYEG